MAWRRPESVLVVIYTPAEILLLKRNADFVFWQSVTGAEETGITGIELVDCRHSVNFDISPRWADRYAPGVTVNKEHVFLCPLAERVEVSLCPEEHTEYVWLDTRAALERITSATNRAAVERFVIES